MTKEVADIDHTVYLLRSKNPKYLNWSYIGYTVNYQRRLKQHNAGVDKGGAKRTNDKGPWEFYLIIIGFMSDVTALRFEWAWQNYLKFKSLKEKVGRRKSRESKLNLNLRVLNILLNHPPWHRAPLKIVVFDSSCDIYKFLPNRPEHIEVTLTTQITNDHRNVDNEICFICSKNFVSTDHVLYCYNLCDSFFHVFCCADYLNRGTGHIIPTMGSCPKCRQSLIWGRLIRSAVFVQNKNS